MPVTLNGLNSTPRSDTLNALDASAQINLATIGASQANTAVQAAYISPVQYKIRKVAVYFSAISAITGLSFNLVVGTGAYTQGNAAPNDNSFDPTTLTTIGTGAPQFTSVTPVLGGVGYPTNVAVAGQSVFAADVGFTVANFPNITVGTGGYAVLIPTNYDAVYPVGIPLTLRATTGTGASITNLNITLAIVPIRLRPAPPGPEAVAPLPGVDY